MAHARVSLSEISFDKELLEENAKVEGIRASVCRDNSAFLESRALLENTGICSCSKVLVADDSPMN